MHENEFGKNNKVIKSRFGNNSLIFSKGFIHNLNKHIRPSLATVSHNRGSRFNLPHFNEYVDIRIMAIGSEADTEQHSTNCLTSFSE